MSAFSRVLPRWTTLLLVAGLALTSFAQPARNAGAGNSTGTTMEAQWPDATLADPFSQHVLPVDSATIAAGKKGGKPPAKGTANGERAYMRFTPKGKREVKEENARKHEGANQCENCGVTTAEAQKSQKGVTPPANETQVDHVIPRARGGAGAPSNGQVLCRDCNNEKSDKL